MSTKSRATIEDLYNVPENGKAEILSGKLVLMPLAGWGPSRAAGEIYVGLRDYERATMSGEAYLGNVAYVVRIPGLRTFSPDAAFFWGKPASGPGEFIEGAPIFAAEVRSEGDYGPAAERDMAAKRADYFLLILTPVPSPVAHLHCPEAASVGRRGCSRRQRSH